MATGLAAQIMDALLARATLMATQGPMLPVAMPEIAFTPPTNGKYLQIDFFANAPAWEGLASGKLGQGLLQVTVVWPRGGGIIQPGQVAQLVMAHFPKGLMLYSGAAKVTVSREPWDATPISDDADLRIPVTISWTATAV